MMIALITIVAILVVLLIIAVPTLAMTQSGEYDNVSFGFLRFWGVLAVVIILGIAFNI